MLLVVSVFVGALSTIDTSVLAEPKQPNVLYLMACVTAEFSPTVSVDRGGRKLRITAHKHTFFALPARGIEIRPVTLLLFCDAETTCGHSSDRTVHLWSSPPTWTS